MACSFSLPDRRLTREERRANQRGRILRAAIQCFGMDGVVRTTVEDIARQASVSRVTFYEFFDNRDDCFVVSYQTAIESIARSVAEAIVSHPDDDVVSTCVATYLDRLVSDPAVARLIHVESAANIPGLPNERARVRATFAEFIRAGWATVDPIRAAAPEAEMISIGLTGTFNEVMMHVLETGKLPEAPRYVDALVELLYRVFEPDEVI